MRRNRGKNQAGAIRLVPALKASLLCLLLGGTAVGYVVQKNKIYEMARQVFLREEQLRQLQKYNKTRASYLAHLERPDVIAKRVNELGLGLQHPLPGQVVHLPEPVAPSPSNGAPSVLMVQQ